MISTSHGGFHTGLYVREQKEAHYKWGNAPPGKCFKFRPSEVAFGATDSL